MKNERPAYIVNMDDAPGAVREMGDHWGGEAKPLTPYMKENGGQLGINRFVLRTGHALCPFHYHTREDEAFVVLSGRGVLRYGEELSEIGPGDVISCPAGTQTAHQICNPHAEDLVYLAIGRHAPQEVCVYPDSGKVLVRGIGRIMTVEDAQYFDGEPSPPRILEFAKEALG